MKLKTVAISILVSLLLVGCAKQPSSKSTSSSSSSTKVTSLWDAKKSSELTKYMKTFSKQTARDYQPYDPKNQVSFYGAKFPDYLTKNKIKVGEKSVSGAWSKNGEGKADYNVVAIYSDIESSGGGFGSTLYLFAVQDKTPVILSTQQNQGQPDKMIHFDSTTNTELWQKFSEIVTGKEPDKNAIVPADMQGTWYGYDEASRNADKIDVIVFGPNMITKNDRVHEIHDINTRDSEDMKILKSGNVPTGSKKNSWFAASNYEDNGRTWLNLRGWYQTAGAGSFYSVKNRTIDGQNVAVLTTASGANVTADGHFYKNKEVAIAQGAMTFADENNEN